MAKVSAGDIRNGVTIEVDGKVCQVIDFMHVKPGKGAAFVRVKMKNIIDGGGVETTFVQQRHLNRLTLKERKCSICTTMENSITTWTTRHLSRL